MSRLDYGWQTMVREREADMATLWSHFRAVPEGKGRTLLLQGLVRTGETSLLAVTCGLAEEAEFVVLSASGSELEPELASGVVHQLRERRFRELWGGGRRRNSGDRRREFSSLGRLP